MIDTLSCRDIFSSFNVFWTFFLPFSFCEWTAFCICSILDLFTCFIKYFEVLYVFEPLDKRLQWALCLLLLLSVWTQYGQFHLLVDSIKIPSLTQGLCLCRVIRGGEIHPPPSFLFVLQLLWVFDLNVRTFSLSSSFRPKIFIFIQTEAERPFVSVLVCLKLCTS